MTTDCCVCNEPVEPLLALGDQPLSNRFPDSGDHTVGEFPLTVGQCDGCSMVQLVEGPPAERVPPPEDGVRYREPEDHLDGLADTLSDLPNLDTEATILGLSYKDDSLLDRIRKRGFRSVSRIRGDRDLGTEEPSPGMARIQAALDEETASQIRKESGPADLVVARHVLEHAYDPIDFLSSLKRLARDDGYFVFEVPDCQQTFESLQYTGIWEEHRCYPTPRTLRTLLREANLEVRTIESHAYPFEDSLIAIATPSQTDPSPRGRAQSEATSKDHRERARTFASRFEEVRQNHRERLEAWKEQGGEIAILGAGHHGIAFVNYFGVADLVDFFVDDDPNKQGNYIPGTGLPILGSETLTERQVDLCLLAVNPEAEDSVVEQNQSYLDEGGTFRSVFHTSRYGWEIDDPNDSDARTTA